MANCNFISSDYSLPCRDGMGGLKAVYIGQYDASATYTYDTAGESITGATHSNTFYKFEQRQEVPNFTETGNYGENGTRFFEQVVEISLEKMTPSLRNTLDLLGQSRIQAIVEDSNSNYWLIGQNEGAWVTASEGGSGQAKGDMNGVNITITGRERFPAEHVDSAALTDFGI